MKLRSSTLSIVVFALLVPSVRGLSNQPSARRADSTDPDARTGQSALESIVPRDGLQFYLEMTSAAVGQLSGVKSGTAPLGNLVSAGPLKLTAMELAAFVMANSYALANARFALAGYADNNTAIVVEAANDVNAAQINSAMARLLVANRASGRTANDVSVTANGRVIMAGSQALVARFTEGSGARTLADDPEFAKARSHFSSDPIFAFVELNSRTFNISGNGGASAAISQTPAMLAALSGMPYAIALGGSLEGESATVRALLIGGPKNGGGQSGFLGGLLTAVDSSSSSDETNAARFASQNTDVFIDLKIDWDKLLDALQSVFGMFAGAVAAGANASPQGAELQASGMQNADFVGLLESSLGFSIKHDLIPTLGNEIAITLSGFHPTAPSSVAAVTKTGTNAGVKSSPRLLLMVAVRDEVKFEKFLGKLISGPKGPAQPLAQSLYRGATIKSGKDIAYAITGGFLLAGGSVADIRRAIDAQALGNSLVSMPEFRRALPGSNDATLQAYLSSRLTKEILDSLSKEAASSAGLSQQLAAGSQTPSPIGLSVVANEDGLMIEAHLPTHLLAMALTAMLNSKPAPYGIPGTSTPGAPQSGSRSTPKLTDDDLRFRRP
jgi:hypothetical protein